MSLTPFSSDVEVISALGDQPNIDNNLTSSQLKAKFDQAAGAIKTFLNNTLIPEVEALFSGFTVTTSMLSSSCVTTGKINNKAVTTGKLDDKAVTTAKIDDNAVGASQLATDLTYSAVNLNANQVIVIKSGTDTPVAEDPGEGEVLLNDGEIYIKYTISE